MINSMTGFGAVAGEVEGVAYAVEIRTVNNRYLKSHLRLPDIVLFLEGDIEKLIKKQISRGTINYSLCMKNVSGQALFEVDENAMQGYIAKLKRIAEANGLQSRIDLAGMLTLPGIIQPIEPDEGQSGKMKEVVLKLTAEALERLKQMRRCEGETLVEDMLANCEIMKEKLRSISARSPQVSREYHEKLKTRAEKLLAEAKLDLDVGILAREVAVFAERCDVTEELARLDSHLEQFAAGCKDGENIGRRLDFISQEMLREANTIASKASDVQINQCVIDVKCAIDRIKEQVQNIE